MKFFWLKLDKNFFQQHDVRLIESMPNGKEMLLFYIKLLAESVSHDGNLRFSDEVAYDNEVLAGITNTDISIVESAMSLFEKFKLVEIKEDATITMTQIKDMTGSVTDWAEKKRRYRETKTNEGQAEDTTRTCPIRDKRQEIRDKNNIHVSKKFTPPTFEDVKAYCHERGDKVDAQKFFDYFEAGKWHDSEGKPVRNWKQKVITWEKHTKPMTKQNYSGIKQQNYNFDEIERMLKGQ